jgi:type VI secretion system protein ImpC
MAAEEAGRGGVSHGKSSETGSSSRRAAHAAAKSSSRSQYPRPDCREGPAGEGPQAAQWGKSLVGEFVNQMLEGEMTVSPDIEAMINQRIAQIDHLLSLQ